MMKNELVRNLRRLQVIITSVVFVLVTVLCYNVTGFKLTEIQLSEWGTDSSVGWIWNSMVVMVSIVILFNVISWIRRHPRLKYKKPFYILFAFMSLNLLIVGIFPTSYGLLHTIPAFIFFFSYPLTVFSLSFFNRKHMIFKEWIKHLLISIFMITLPLMCIGFFNGMAIPEMMHILVLIFWNITLLKKYKIKNPSIDS